jgi:hypothetical protein
LIFVDFGSRYCSTVILMKLLNQKGIAQLLVLVLVVLGIGVGTYLVSQRTNLIPKASDGLGEIPIKTPFPESARKCLQDAECQEGYFCQLKEDLEPISPEVCNETDNPNCEASSGAARREYGKCLKLGSGEDLEEGEDASEEAKENESEDELNSPKPSRSPAAPKDPKSNRP